MLPAYRSSFPIDCPVHLDASDCLALADEVDIGARWRCHPVAEEESRMWWLVIDHVLPGDCQPVLRALYF